MCLGVGYELKEAEERETKHILHSHYMSFYHIYSHTHTYIHTGVSGLQFSFILLISWLFTALQILAEDP